MGRGGCDRPGFQRVFDGPGILAEIIGSSLATVRCRDRRQPELGSAAGDPANSLAAMAPQRGGSSQRFDLCDRGCPRRAMHRMGDEPDERPCYAAVALSDLARWLDAKESRPSRRNSPRAGKPFPAQATVPLSAAAAPRNLGGGVEGGGEEGGRERHVWVFVGVREGGSGGGGGGEGIGGRGEMTCGVGEGEGWTWSGSRGRGEGGGEGEAGDGVKGLGGWRGRMEKGGVDRERRGGGGEGGGKGEVIEEEW